MTDGTMLNVEDLTVEYKVGGRRITAVDRISFDMKPGEVVGLVGESGCGKSTTARAICGLEPQQHGSITFDGKRVKPFGLRRRGRHFLKVQMVFQNPNASLNPRRKIASQLEDGLRISDNPDRWTVESLLEAVGLPASAGQRHAHQFSGGQRQRIAIARAVSAGPSLLIGDEPIASLDASLQLQIARLMRELAVGSDAGLLFISHDLGVVRLIADRVVVMKSGKVVETGPVEQVWDDPRDAYTRKLLAAIPRVDGKGTLPPTSATTVVD